MKIIFDNESQKSHFFETLCPNSLIPELQRRCMKECQLNVDPDVRCPKCFEKFEDFIQLEVKDEQSR